MDDDKWKSIHETMVSLLPTVEDWFAHIQKMINALKDENKEEWHKFVVDYDRTYGYPTMMHFMSGSPPSDEIPTNPSENYRYLHHSFRKFKPKEWQ